jgi:hypothetical protein
VPPIASETVLTELRGLGTVTPTGGVTGVAGAVTVMPLPPPAVTVTPPTVTPTAPLDPARTDPAVPNPAMYALVARIET